MAVIYPGHIKPPGRRNSLGLGWHGNGNGRRPSKPNRPPVIRQGRMLTDYFAQGDWRGHRCFVIGGGPSLKGFDWSRLDGELAIGTNLAFLKCNPALLFSMDNRFLGWLQKRKYGQDVTDRFDNYTHGYKVWLDNARREYPPDMLTIGCIGSHTWSPSLEQGIGSCGNSGYCALNLAVLLGASPIYLLGFDGKGNGRGKQAWWHMGHPEVQPERVYGKFDVGFSQHAAPGARDAGAQVINLNTDSTYTCFEFGDIEDVEPIQRPVICAYATENTGYTHEARELNNSLRKWGLERDIQTVPNLGTWQANTQYKAIFMKGMLRKHAPKPVVYVDADARFRRYPELFDNFAADFAAHWRKFDNNGNRRLLELLSGTLYFANTPRAYEIVDAWIAENKRNPETWDQKTLGAVVRRLGDGVVDLPPEYCAIFDGSMAADPVIEHMQASRRLKREVNSK